MNGTINSGEEELEMSTGRPIQNKPAKKPFEERVIGQYRLGKSIGEGTFGKVKLATHILTNEKVIHNFQNR